MNTIFHILEIAGLTIISLQLRKVKMTISEYADAVGNIADQLTKALGEIQQELQNMDQVPQSAIDKLTKAQQAAQALDDLNPDQPPPPQP